MGRERRRNDALSPHNADSPFVREVKRFARARGLTGAALAAALDCNQGTINKHFNTRRRRPHLDTVQRYATALGVSAAYLRVIARHWLPEDVDGAMRATYSAAESLAVHLDGITIAELWRRLQLATKADDVLAAVYCDQQRRAAETACGISDPNGSDPIGVFIDALEGIGIEVGPYLRVRDDLAYNLALFLTSDLRDDDVNAVLRFMEKRLKARRIDVRAFQRAREEFATYGLTKYIKTQVALAKKANPI